MWKLSPSRPANRWIDGPRLRITRSNCWKPERRRALAPSTFPRKTLCITHTHSLTYQTPFRQLVKTFQSYTGCKYQVLTPHWVSILGMEACPESGKNLFSRILSCCHRSSRVASKCPSLMLESSAVSPFLISLSSKPPRSAAKNCRSLQMDNIACNDSTFGMREPQLPEFDHQNVQSPSLRLGGSSQPTFLVPRS